MRPILEATLHPLESRAGNTGSIEGDRDPGGSPAATAASHGRAPCPVCLGPLTRVREPHGAPRRVRHVASEDDARCPLSTMSYQPDGIIIRHARDIERERAQRAEFIGNSAHHHQVMQQAARAMTLRRFMHLIAYADVLNLWSYPALEQQDLPYVLLALAAFIRDRDAAGETIWVRFCFDGSVRDVGDLWSRHGPPPRLFRMVYRVPDATPFPTAAELLHYETVRRGGVFPEHRVRCG